MLFDQMYHAYHTAVVPFMGWAGFIDIVCTSYYSLYDIWQPVGVGYGRLVAVH